MTASQFDQAGLTFFLFWQGHDFYAEAKAQRKQLSSPSTPHTAPTDPVPKRSAPAKNEIIPKSQHCSINHDPASSSLQEGTSPRALYSRSLSHLGVVDEQMVQEQQLLAENEELRAALEDAGEMIDQLLASERALKQSAVSLCAALSGIAEETSEVEGTPLSARRLSRLGAEVATEVDATQETPPVKPLAIPLPLPLPPPPPEAEGEAEEGANDIETQDFANLEHALAGMQEVDLASSFETIGAKLAASESNKAFLAGVIAAQEHVTLALEDQIDGLGRSLEALAGEQQQRASAAGGLGIKLQEARAEVQAQVCVPKEP